MRTFRKSIATGVLAVAFLAGAVAPSFAQSSDQVEASLTIVDYGVVTVDVSASSFPGLSYTASGSQTSSGRLTFNIDDPRYAKGNWQVTASVTDFSPSFLTDIDLVATSSAGSLSAPPVTLSSSGSPVTVIQAGATSQGSSSYYVQFQATINVPAGVAPGTYTSTITVAVTNLED